MLLIFDENCRSKNYRLRRSITLTGRLRTLDSRHGTTGWTGTKRSCLVSTWNHRGESVESIFLGRTNRDAARCVLKGPRWDTGLPGRGKSGFLFAASMSGCYLSWIPVGYGDTARTSRYQAPPSRSFLLVASTRDMEFPPRRPDHRNSRCSPSFLGVIFNFLPDWFSPPNPPNTSPRTWNRAPAAPPTGLRVIKYRMNALLRGIAIFFPSQSSDHWLRHVSLFRAFPLVYRIDQRVRLYVRVRRFAGETTYGKFRLICCRILQHLQEIDWYQRKLHHRTWCVSLVKLRPLFEKRSVHCARLRSIRVSVCVLRETPDRINGHLRSYSCIKKLLDACVSRIVYGKKTKLDWLREKQITRQLSSCHERTSLSRDVRDCLSLRSLYSPAHNWFS